MDITLIGCGQMGGAIAHRLSMENQHRFYFYDHIFEKAESLAKECQGKALHHPLENFKEGELVDQALEEASAEHVFMIAVKPQDLEELKTSLAPLKKAKLIISILSGKTVSTLESCFPSIPILRMMPNLAVRHGKGVVALTKNPALDSLTSEIENLLEPLGLCAWFPEKQLDALTALTGSGPAFIYVLIEAMVGAGVHMGLRADETLPLILQMMKGAIASIENSKLHPAELKWHVTSPGGTTIAGLRKMEELAVRSGLFETFLAAYQRATELG